LKNKFEEMETDLMVLKPKLTPDDADIDAEKSSRPMKVMDAASIVAGTAIGGGFLALPSVISPIGYAPTAFGLIISWVYLTLSAIAFVEAAGLVIDYKSQNRQNDHVISSKVAKGDNDTSSVATATDECGTSVAGIIGHAFGKRWACLGGIAFLAQILAVVTAQVVKGAEVTSKVVGIPYVASCLIPTSLLGLFVFSSKPEVVEGVNTVLTMMMIVGFVALMCCTISSGNIGKLAASSVFARSEWSTLLPNMRVSWSMPVFINLIAYGQAMPVVIDRMVQQSQSSLTTTASASGRATASNNNKEDKLSSSLKAARFSTFLGSLVPIVLSLIWAAISTALISPTSSNPIFSLLESGPSIAIPVLLLCAGAIGTTLIGSFLAIGQFATDIICRALGYCSPSWMNLASIMTVLIPCILACLGSSL